MTDSADPSHPSDVTRLELSWASGQHFDVTDASGRTMVLDGDKASGFSPMEAARASVGVLTDRVKGTGGVILVDRRGALGLAFNTPQMSYAHGTVGGPIVVGH